jgi:DNA-binding MarR family transcriptional regulator
MLRPMNSTMTRSERLDRAMSILVRRGTGNRLHRLLVHAVGSDIDRAGYLVLKRIQLEGPTRITDLADRMGVEPSTASRHVQTLEEHGWLEKQPQTEDRRVILAGVTPSGLAVVERVETERHRIFDRALAEWDDEDVDRFVELFERFANDLSDAVLERHP